MCASVGVKAKGESDQMMRNEGGGVFPESLMSPKWVFDTVKHRCLTVSNTHFGDMRSSGNTPPQERSKLRITFCLKIAVLLRETMRTCHDHLWAQSAATIKTKIAPNAAWQAEQDVLFRRAWKHVRWGNLGNETIQTLYLFLLKRK